MQISQYQMRRTWDAQGKAVAALKQAGMSTEEIALTTGMTTNMVLRSVAAFQETDPEYMDVLKERDWRELFHTASEVLNAPPVEFAIHGFLQEEGINMIGGLPGHGKTLIGMSMVKALLTGAPLFGHAYFSVRKSSRVLYLSPEVGISALAHRLRLFKLMPFIENGSLLVRSLGSPAVPLTDYGILNAAKGADVFLDTAVRFMEGDENSSTEQKVFTNNLFEVVSAGGRTVVGLHHSGKGTAGASNLTLENSLRGSGEIGAMLSTAWAIRQVDGETNRIYVTNIKCRDFEACAPFVLEGRPWIDTTGDFKMVCRPGDAGLISDHGAVVGGRPTVVDEDAGAEITRLKAQGLSEQKIAEAVKLSKSAVHRFLMRGSRVNRSETKAP
jgi:orotate phosphoribosyltransferase-like protein